MVSLQSSITLPSFLLMMIATPVCSQPTLEMLIAIAETLEVPPRDFFPSGGFDDSISQNRLDLEAEAMALLRGLSDSQLTVALVQIKALGEL